MKQNKRNDEPHKLKLNDKQIFFFPNLFCFKVKNGFKPLFGVKIRGLIIKLHNEMADLN